MGQSCHAPGGSMVSPGARHIGGWSPFENGSPAPWPQSRDGPGGVASAVVPLTVRPLKGLVGKEDVWSSGGGGDPFPAPPPPWAMTRGGSPSVLFAALGSCFWPGSCLAVPGGAFGPRVLLWPVTSCFPVTPAACPPDTFGKNCSSSCSCRNGGTCDPVTGTCRCPPGVGGAHCEDGGCLGSGRGHRLSAAPPPSVVLPRGWGGKDTEEAPSFQVCYFPRGLRGGRW